MVDPRQEPRQRFYASIWMKRSAAMLASKSSVGVTPNVNLRNLLHAGEALVLNPRTDVIRSPKEGYR